MLANLRSANLVWPTVAASFCFVVLIGLGGWQWQRKEWKDNLLEALQSATITPPLRLSQAVGARAVTELELQRVALQGRYAHELEFHVWSPEKDTVMWRVITVLVLTDSPSSERQFPNHVLVIRGEVDAAHKSAALRPAGQVALAHPLVGRIRFSSSNWSTPNPDLAQNEWYALDLEAMRAEAKKLIESRSPIDPDFSTEVRFAPFFVEAEEALAPPPAPQPNQHKLSLHNRHLAYALTWWGLAATLLGVYVTFAIGRFRETKVSP
ncbi:MAG: SURF1 family protein [Hyphomicrobiaceae bacterium]